MNITSVEGNILKTRTLSFINVRLKICTEKKKLNAIGYVHLYALLRSYNFTQVGVLTNVIFNTYFQYSQSLKSAWMKPSVT